ncbi:MAG: Dna2/Cas4 domain-containing protein [Caldilineaceae bacterium]|nr:Dna2/Cas4 domain-containing protein [Caldilineaceae bacterium]
MIYLLLAALVIILVGAVFLWLGRRAYRSTGLPIGEVVYSDTGAWQEVEAPLLSRRYGLVGKPDYLVETKEGRKLFTIPVEVKSRPQPAAPFDSHILQLATYCLLVEDTYKLRPPHGLLHYADATLKIPFTDELRRAVLEAADGIRRSRRGPDVSRSHEDAARCGGCGYLHGCGADALVAPDR